MLQKTLIFKDSFNNNNNNIILIIKVKNTLITIT